MKRKQALICTTAVAIVALMLTERKFHADRCTELARYHARVTAFHEAHSNLVEMGPEYARLRAEVLIIGGSRGQEELMTSRFGPWWPSLRLHSYEKIPFWKRPSKQEIIENHRAALEKFKNQIGVTNRQQEAAIFSRMAEIKKNANQKLEPTVKTPVE